MKYYVGLDLGGTNIAAGVVDEKYNIVADHSLPTLKHRTFEEIVEDMARAVREVAKIANLTLDDFTSIGIGAPSSVNPTTKRLAFANNLRWKNVPLIEEFRKHIDKPVFLANDADCAALGEAVAGVAKDYGSILLITLGTGVGGGLIMNDQIFNGADGNGFEPGHTTLILGGVPCTCGRLGCFESYASITGLIRETIEAIALNPTSLMREICGNDFCKVSGRTAFEAAKRGDAAGLAVVEKYAYYVGSGISSLVAALRPHAVLIGGGISNEGDYLLDPVRKVVAETVYSKDTVKPPEIIKASLGNSAGIIGAAFLETQKNI